MYFQRDYILRMIEMLGELARSVFAMLHDRDAYAKLDEVATRACGLPLKMLRGMQIEALTDMLDEPQRYLAAELLLIAAAVDARRQADEELLPTRMQALALLTSIHDAEYLPRACDSAARVMREHFTQLPLESFLDAGRLFERGAQYAHAEDAWWAAYEQDASLRGELLAFYDRMEAVDARSLLAGGLSEDEVAEGRAALN